MKRILHITLLLLLTAAAAHAQYTIDALRISQPGSVVSARSAAMGNAFTGLADDFSALYWNPAGLGQLRSPEFSLGMTYLKANNDATFLGATTSYNNSSTGLNSIGFALPFPVARGSFVLAAGYNRITDFTGALMFEGYNQHSSILNSLWDSDEYYDLAWQVGLEDTSQWSPITRNVLQSGDVLESGSLNQWSFGGAMEVAPNLNVGLGLNIQTGEYKWIRTFVETDPQGMNQGPIVGVGNATRSGFKRFTMDETVSQDLSGWNLKLGVLYSIPERASFGLTIQTPTTMTIKEDFTRSGHSSFVNGGNLSYSYKTYNDYEVTTPWVFTFGVSGRPVDFITVSGDVDLADYTQMEFSNSSASDFNLSEKNKNLKKLLQATTNYRLGMELRIPRTELAVRGGYGMQFTPFKDSPSDFDRKIISFGLGYTFEHSFSINATYVMTKYSQENLNYKDPDTQVANEYMQTNEKIDTSALMFSIAYRF